MNYTNVFNLYSWRKGGVKGCPERREKELEKS